MPNVFTSAPPFLKKRRLRNSPHIPHRGKHLDELEPLDVAFITFNRYVPRSMP
jgi:hypothetical protein